MPIASSSAWRALASVAPLAIILSLCAHSQGFAADSKGVPFHTRVADRALIDLYQNRNYPVDSDREPVPEPAPTNLPPPSGDRIQVVRPRLRDSAMRYRSQFSNSIPVLPGYRAAILDQATERPPFRLIPALLTEPQRAAADWIEKHLAADGLLQTLARVFEILGTSFPTATPESLETLRPLGLPVDLLAAFAPESNLSHAEQTAWVANHVLRAVANQPASSPQFELRQLPFRFSPAQPGFRVSTESGTEAIGWVRMQAGGGYRKGIVPGGSIDLIARMVAALPQADFLVSVPVEFFEPFARLAAGWPLTRPHQLTLVREPFMVSAWAQDNGKAGIIESEPPQPDTLSSTNRFGASATLVPRFASIHEGTSLFAPGESFLADGLRASGHPVIQSPLLFQGGNLLAVQHPRTGRRLLLIGDGEIRRNESLGLSEPQIREAFRIEFGVDECVVIPGCSYHLDFDVSVRAHAGDLVVLVNEPLEAARHITELGVQALAKNGVIPTEEAASIVDSLRQQRYRDAVDRLARVAPALRPPETADGSTPRPIEKRWSQCFASAPIDSATGNLQSFLLGWDLLEVEASGTNRDLGSSSPQRRAYLEALRRSERMRREQIESVQRLGWKIVRVPSIQDLHRGINYLNGIHFPGGFVMPAFGGFYQSLDNLAAETFQRAFGPGFQVIPILSAESQRKYGGLHCVTAIYPTPKPKPTRGPHTGA